MFSWKLLKMNKVIKDIWQLIISASNATLEVPSLRPCLYLNINSIRNKSCDLDKIVDGNIDILCITESKLDESYPNNQFVYQSIYTGYYKQQRWLDGIC